jgi:hypothetical protein
MKKQSGESALVILAAVLGVACAQLGFAQTFKNVPVQSNADISQVSAGGDSVWALDNFGNPYLYQGGSEFALDKSSAPFIQIAAGGGSLFSQPDAIWALDASHNVYTITDSGFFQEPGSLVQIAVGPGYQDNLPPVRGLGNQPYQPDIQI